MHHISMRLALFLALALSLGTAQAADFDYNWLSAGVIQDDPSGGDSAHGLFVDGSYAFASDFTLQLNYYRYSLDSANCGGHPVSSCDLFSRSLGVGLVGAGWHLPLTDETDLLVDAGLGHYQDRHQFSFEQFGVGPCFTGTVAIPGGCAQMSRFDDSGTSYQLDVGVRIQCSCSLEFRAYVGGLETSRFVGFLSLEDIWTFAGPVALTVQARRLSSSDNQYRIGLRYLF